MAYTELTCDDDGLSLETLYRMSMVDMGDGTYAQRVVEYADEGPTIAFHMESGAVTADYYQNGIDGNGYPLFFKVGGNPLLDKIYADNSGSWYVDDGILPGLQIYVNADAPSASPVVQDPGQWLDLQGYDPTPVFTLP